MSIENLYNLLVDEIRELREVNQSILRFMGESTNDRVQLHKITDNHENRIQKLEDAKKKRSHINNPIVWIIGTAIAIKANVQDLIEVVKKIGH